MALFNKSITKELTETKAAYSTLEKEFTDFKAAHAEFEAKKSEYETKLSAYEADLTAVKGEKEKLAADLVTAQESIKTLETKASTVTGAALLELEKVGQPPINQASVRATADADKLWEDLMQIKDPLERRAFYVKNIKPKTK
jgi:chromosome segregation ATPase